MDQKRFLESSNVLIIGYGVTGQAVARFCESHNKKYFVFDENKQDADIRDIQSLQKIVKQVDIAIPSPGVSLKHAVFSVLAQNHIPIIGELELAAAFLGGEFIAVTGTNGKSTTVKLINELLTAAGIANSLVGNIGKPLISAVNESPKDYYVVEESSYQLELIGDLKHHVAVCLNVTPDHLDRHSSFADYATTKAKIMQASTQDDFFVYNTDDETCLRMSWEARCQKIPFSLVNPVEQGGFIDGTAVVIRLGAQEYRFDSQSFSLKGLHNLENILAALLSALLIDQSDKAVLAYEKVLKNFCGLPHRLQRVGEYQGIIFYDDSKATNVGAVSMSLASFDQPIIWLAGGQDKEGDFSSLKGLVAAKVKQLVLFGEARQKIYDALRSAVKIDVVDDMRAAIKCVHNIASQGDVVLLSPACASFDQYKNYKERGKDFENCVEEFFG